MSKITYEEVKESLKNILSYVNEILDAHNLSGGLGNDYLVVKNYINQAQKQEKLLGLYKQVYDKSNAEVLKMFTYEQDEKTTLTNIIGHLDNSETIVKIKELEK